MIRIGALASGRGSNLQAILDRIADGYIKNAQIAIAISDRKSKALELAKARGIKTLYLDPAGKSKEEYDAEIAQTLKKEKVDLVILAGYMRILTAKFISAFPNKIMNVHPALLPSFPGMHAQKQAVEKGAKLSGCTVHFVDDGVDTGPIILQAAVPVLLEDTEETLSDRILQQEHRIFPEAVRLYCEGKLKVTGRKVELLEQEKYPRLLTQTFVKLQDLRYGENPHQSAAFYKDTSQKEPSVATATQLQGKELSFNNIVDIDAALETVKEFGEPAAVVIKHTNPCGACESDSLLKAYLTAREADPLSAFGGVVGLNRTVDAETAKELASTFLEAAIAPDFDPQALELLKEKKNLRLLKTGPFSQNKNQAIIKGVNGGMLLQDRDLSILTEAQLRTATKRAPTQDEMRDLLFGWKIAKHVKSNAIVFAKNKQTIGVGAGQMSRVVSVKIAAEKAGSNSKGCVMASDAFFPFKDGVEEAAKAGITAVIQPGGSMRDAEVIEAADKGNMAMVLTGTRCFWH